LRLSAPAFAQIIYNDGLTNGTDAVVGGEPSDAAALWEHGGTDCGAAFASGVAEKLGKQIRQKGGKRRNGV